MTKMKTKLKSGYTLHEGAQLPTRPVTVVEIMSDPRFAQGVADVRAQTLSGRLRSLEAHERPLGIFARTTVGSGRAAQAQAQGPTAKNKRTTDRARRLSARWSQRRFRRFPVRGAGPGDSRAHHRISARKYQSIAVCEISPSTA
jgi:hypothetical protein